MWCWFKNNAAFAIASPVTSKSAVCCRYNILACCIWMKRNIWRGLSWVLWQHLQRLSPVLCEAGLCHNWLLLKLRAEFPASVWTIMNKHIWKGHCYPWLPHLHWIPGRREWQGLLGALVKRPLIRFLQTWQAIWETLFIVFYVCSCSE